MYVCMHACMYIHICIYMCVYMYMCMYSRAAVAASTSKLFKRSNARRLKEKWKVVCFEIGQGVQKAHDFQDPLSRNTSNFTY